MQLKQCTHPDCKQPLKPISEFYNCAAAPDGKYWWCIECHKRYFKELRKRHTENYTGAIPGDYYCKGCDQSRPHVDFGPCKSRWNGLNGYCKFCQAKKRETKRIEVLRAYGGDTPTCACPGCNETNVRFLTIDHMDGNGHEHRRELRRQGKSYDIYVFLRQNNYPPGFQVLCWNCNCCKGKWGICAHEDPEAYLASRYL